MTKTDIVAVASPVTQRLGAARQGGFQTSDGAFLAHMALPLSAVTPAESVTVTAAADAAPEMPKQKSESDEKAIAVPPLLLVKAGSGHAPDVLPNSATRFAPVSDLVDVPLSNVPAPVAVAMTGAAAFATTTPFEPAAIALPTGAEPPSNLAGNWPKNPLAGHTARENAFYLRSDSPSNSALEGPTPQPKTGYMNNRRDAPVRPVSSEMGQLGHGERPPEPQALPRDKAADTKPEENINTVNAAPVAAHALPQPVVYPITNQGGLASIAVNPNEMPTKDVEPNAQPQSGSARSSALPADHGGRQPTGKGVDRVSQAGPTQRSVFDVVPDAPVETITFQREQARATLPETRFHELVGPNPATGNHASTSTTPVAQGGAQSAPTEDAAGSPPRGILEGPRPVTEPLSVKPVLFQPVEAATGRMVPADIAQPDPKVEHPKTAVPDAQQYRQSLITAPRTDGQTTLAETPHVTQLPPISQGVLDDGLFLRFVFRPSGPALPVPPETATSKTPAVMFDAPPVFVHRDSDPAIDGLRGKVAGPSDANETVSIGPGFSTNGAGNTLKPRPDAAPLAVTAPAQPALSTAADTAPLPIATPPKTTQKGREEADSKDGFTPEMSKLALIKDGIPYGDRMFTPAAKPNLPPALAGSAITTPPIAIPISAPPHHIKTVVAADKTRSLELSLTPEDLGKLRIVFTPDGDKIRVVIQAERPETLDFLRRNTESLSSELRQSGYSSTSFSFASWGDAPNSRPNLRQDTSAEPFESADEGPAKPRPNGVPIKPSGLDLRI